MTGKALDPELAIEATPKELATHNRNAGRSGAGGAGGGAGSSGGKGSKGGRGTAVKGVGGRSKAKKRPAAAAAVAGEAVEAVEAFHGAATEATTGTLGDDEILMIDDGEAGVQTADAVPTGGTGEEPTAAEGATNTQRQRAKKRAKGGAGRDGGGR